MATRRAQAWAALQAHAAELCALGEDGHLRALLRDAARTDALVKAVATPGGGSEPLLLDLTRQRVTGATLEKLVALADAVDLERKIAGLFDGTTLNQTEGRAVLHTALRAPKAAAGTVTVNGRDAIGDVHAVLEKMEAFVDAVRSGAWTGATGKPLTSVVAIGIGGSFLGASFVHTALKTCTHAPQLGGPSPQDAAAGRQLRFVANVDPVDCATALEGLDPETTLVVIISKTFTTAETMLNARTARRWVSDALGDAAVAKHMVAVSTALDKVEAFGIDPKNAFGFWDWVGGRYSVTSAVGILPLALQYSMTHARRFLAGARAMDEHFREAPLLENAPVLLGLVGVWNTSFLGIASRAVLPYCESLGKLPAHVQQLSMESNGKGVAMDGTPLAAPAGEIEFGEAGTNGQHSFYQLVHQGRLVSAEFIGAMESHRPVFLPGERVSSHDELMANFFAQPDALALGKTPAELRAKGVPEELVPHKTFEGNRPSLSLLMPRVDAFTVGQLLALYEHRVAVQGFLWDVNSFDQWGVELGKELAGAVRDVLAKAPSGGEDAAAAVAATPFNDSTKRLLGAYMASRSA